MTKAQLENYELTHEHNHGPWIMCQDLDDEFCLVTSPIGRTGIFTQAFLAWKKKLSVFTKPEDPRNPESLRVDSVISQAVREPLDELRKALKQGKLVVKETHIIKP